MKTTLIIVGVLAAAMLFAAFKFSRVGLESPEYAVIKQAGEFELRAYPESILVSTEMDSPDPMKGGSFMRLFRYISGDNAAQQEISMTTPVLRSGEYSQQRMSFVVPKAIAAGGAPLATNDLVQLDTMAAGKFAAYKFSGSWNPERIDKGKQKLQAWIEDQSLIAIEKAVVANYDPPFTPDMLKRNEILVRVQRAK